LGRTWINYEMRQDIEKRIRQGQTILEIAYKMKLSQSAMYAEIKRGMTAGGDYSADQAQATYEANIKRRGNRTQRKERPA